MTAAQRRHRTPIVVTAIGVVAALCLGGASCGSDHNATKAKAPRSTTVPSGPDTIRLMRAGIVSSIGTYEWPAAYTPTADGFGPLYETVTDTLFTVADGERLVGFWNLCAWANEGVDRINRSASASELQAVADAIATWTEKNPGQMGDFPAQIGTALGLGNPTEANGFIEGNECRDFPK